MAEDLRHRYAELVTAWSEPGTRLARLTELLAVRDEEMERLRNQLPTCNGLCLRASDVLDDLSCVVGNPVARAHRSCPLHGDLEAAAWELDAALNRAEADRDGWRERAETAERPLSLARERLDALIAAGFGATTDTLRDLRAALDASLPPEEETTDGA